LRLVKRYFAVRSSGGEGPGPNAIRENMSKLYGVTYSHEVTLKVMEARDWGFIVRALMREGGSADEVVLATAFTRDGDGWLRPIFCSGTLRALRTKLKDVGLVSSKSG
jgi:hypothetical protein